MSMSMEKEYIIGIDLGTTNSCVAVIEGGKPIIIPNSEGKRTTPSVIAFTKDDERKIGDIAKRQAVTNPENTVYSIKRFIGKDWNVAKEYNNKVPYNITKNGTLSSVNIGDKKYTPQELSAMVLQKLKKTAEDYLGQEIKKAVITVPAYFGDQERTATKEAGEIAGLQVERIINEPTAAALAYGMDKKEGDSNIAIFDCGGGTFDVSILELGDGIFEVKSTDGDTMLGGDDFDNVIIEWLVKEFNKEHNIDLSKDPMALQRLREAAEKAKIELSSTTSTEINLPYIIPINNIPQHLIKTLSRAKFEQLTDELVKRTIKPCETALKNAKMKVKDIDEVILVGGSTRIPAIQDAVEKFFGKTPNKSVNPDEVVAIGAAIQGGVIAGDESVSDVLLLDVTPLSLGIETMGGVLTKLIESNTTIPCRKSETFSTASDNQPTVDINVLQGERPMVKDNRSLGKFLLDGIPPSPRGVPQIEVTFDIDVNGILSVTAKDKATGKENNITIQGGGQLSDEEIQRMKAEAEENAEADIKEKEKVDKINIADSLIFQTDKQLKEFDDKLSEENKTSIKDALNELKESLSSKEIDKIDSSTENLNEAWSVASTEMYKESADTSNTNDDSDGSNDDVEDVDFEEVDK